MSSMTWRPIPGERVNLMLDAVPHPVLAGLRARLAGWFAEHGVPGV